MGIITVRQVILSMALGASLVSGEPPLNSQYGVPGNYGGNGGVNGGSGTITNSYGTPLNPEGHDAHQDYIDSQPKSYEFGYAVKDAASGNDFGRRETSDGETVRGEYRVQLPDGRTQIVTYTADWRTGFHADVRYEGVASFPDQYNNNNNNNNNNNGGNGYNDFNSNNLDGGYNRGNNGGYNNNYNGQQNGNYHSTGYSGNNNNNNYNYNNNNNNNNYPNNNYDSNSVDVGYNNNYGGYSGNSFGSKASNPVSTYGAPAFRK
ncbi:probable serine/threonine-protein kinase clkA [Athalia rosae]|uniref:probable serine/threonine-protein kinase clkA n=1 Tax=Athalia rosae TaxID=37344 RepID=UPI0020343F7B|nr:probable serine/threonine-protein kinase clkA [Athalia rosae]